MISEVNKVVGKINVGFDYLQRQDIVGGIKCPNLSLRPDKNIRGSLTLENKYAAYKNFYSFLDGNETPNCEFFPKKFHHWFTLLPSFRTQLNFLFYKILSLSLFFFKKFRYND